MCGIVGIVGTTEVAAALYDGLTVLQHRGQDAAGIATADRGHLRVHKGNGLVRDVFDEDAMRKLEGRVGIAHCRYPTAGSEGDDEAQPFYVNSPYGIALAHNGNLINTDALRREVFEQDRRNINTESDSEVLLNVFAHELDTQKALTPESVFRAVEGVNRRAKGGYAVILAVLGLGLVAFRDPHGIRPLVLGKRTTPAGTEYAIASESVALDVLGFERVRDVAPGEAIVVTARGEMFAKQCAEAQSLTSCIFEYVYFARPDSMIDDISVHKARMRMGVTLGEKILRLRPDHDIDVVIPIPDTSRADGARGRREEGLPRVRGAAGAVSEHLRHRHAVVGRTRRAQPHRSGDRTAARLRLADLPGPRGPGDRRRRPQAPGPQVRQLVLQRRIRHRHRTGLLRAHPPVAFGRCEEEAAHRVLTVAAT